MRQEADAILTDDAAAAARDAGMAGLCFDPECYGGPVRRAWMSAVQAKDGHSSNDCVRIARARGRQVAEAVFGEYPTMRFFSFYWWSFNADMMGAFCNGMVEAMPVSARMIDGNEWNGYVAKGPYTYKWHAWDGTFWKATVTPKRPLWETKILGITKALFGKLDLFPNGIKFDFNTRSWHNLYRTG